MERPVGSESASMKAHSGCVLPRARTRGSAARRGRKRLWGLFGITSTLTVGMTIACQRPEPPLEPGAFVPFVHSVTIDSVVAKDTVTYCDTVWAYYHCTEYPGSGAQSRFHDTLGDVHRIRIYFRVDSDTIGGPFPVMYDTLVLALADYGTYTFVKCNKTVAVGDYHWDAYTEAAYYACGATSAITTITDSMFDTAIATASLAVVVACYECQLCRQSLCAMLDASRAVGDSASFYKFDTSDEPALVARLGITVAPTIMFYRDRIEVCRFTGGAPNGAYLDSVREYY